MSRTTLIIRRRKGARTFAGQPAVDIDWILLTGFWNDNGEWKDTSSWID